LLLSSWPNESCETAGRRDGLAFLHASFSQLFHIFFSCASYNAALLKLCGFVMPSLTGGIVCVLNV